MSWLTPPKKWQHKETLTAAKLNAEIKERFEYLNNGGRVLSGDPPIGTSPDYVYAAASATPVPFINDSSGVGLGDKDNRLRGEIVASGADILIIPHLNYDIGGLYHVYLDILIDDEFFLSTLTSDAPTYDGLWNSEMEVAGHNWTLSTPVLWRSPEVGRHTWQLYGWSNTASFGVVLWNQHVNSFITFLEF